LSQRDSNKSIGELSALQDFFEYNNYVRKKYLELLATLPTATLDKDRGASYPSIRDIFVHVLDVYHCWFLAYEKSESCNRWEHARKTGELIPPELKGLSISQMQKMQLDVENLIQKTMSNLSPESLAASFEFVQGSGVERKITTRNVGEMLWHLIEEELQHRGELNALLWQEDIEPPVTSWFTWKRAKKSDS
jgi:uncharacterized damage-inducible protein DinB